MTGSPTLNLDPDDGMITASWSSVSNVTGYELSYSTSSDFSKAAIVSLSSKTTSKVLTGLRNDTRYYIRIRGVQTINKIVQYTAWKTAYATPCNEHAQQVSSALIKAAYLIARNSYTRTELIEELKKSGFTLAVCEEAIDILSKRVSGLFEESRYEDDAYNYLAIGNSITVHGKNSYWWNTCGMAATKAENDYFHLVQAALENAGHKVDAYAYNFVTWETQYTDRGELLFYLDSYLDEKLDLVTIQLGENISNTTTLESDYTELIEYIRKKAPNAKILVIGDFWNNETRTTIKKTAAAACSVSYVSLEEIADQDDYKCGLGTIVYGDDGQAHEVTHSGVAQHPNDRAYVYYANMILSEITY